MKSADEWVIYVHESIHSSAVPAQPFAVDWDANSGGVARTTRPGMRPGQSDVAFTKDYDLKKLYYSFLDKHDVVARTYVANCMGFSIKKLAELMPLSFEGAPDSEWKVRQAIEEGRSEWGNDLRSIGIKSTWEYENND